MTNEELNKIMMKADDDLERLKDRCHFLYEENKRLKEIINKVPNNILQTIISELEEN